METSSIRPPGSSEAREIVKLDQKAGTPENREARLAREEKQRVLFSRMRKSRRVEAAEAVATADDPAPDDKSKYIDPSDSVPSADAESGTKDQA